MLLRAWDIEGARRLEFWNRKKRFPSLHLKCVAYLVAGRDPNATFHKSTKEMSYVRLSLQLFGKNADRFDREGVEMAQGFSTKCSLTSDLQSLKQTLIAPKPPF